MIFFPTSSIRPRPNWAGLPVMASWVTTVTRVPSPFSARLAVTDAPAVLCPPDTEPEASITVRYAASSVSVNRAEPLYCSEMGPSRTFTVPANYSTLIVTYWWYSDTNKTAKQKLDAFTGRLQTTSGTVIYTMQQSWNTGVTNNWVQETFNVSTQLANYKGKQVTLFFEGTNVANQYQPTDFFVDDVLVTAA